MSWSRWQPWSTEAGGLTDIFVFVYTLFNGEASFHWQFGRWGTVLFGRFGRVLVGFFIIYIQTPKLCSKLAWVSLYGPCYTWRADHLNQVILLVWPYRILHITWRVRVNRQITVCWFGLICTYLNSIYLQPACTLQAKTATVSLIDTYV